MAHYARVWKHYPIWIHISSQDEQHYHELLSKPKEVEFQASKMARLHKFDCVLEWQGQSCFQYIKSGGKHATFTQAQDEPLDMICEGMRHDPLAMNLVNMVKEKKTKRFLIEDNLF